jgi:hypothetical protein
LISKLIKENFERLKSKKLNEKKEKKRAIIRMRTIIG